MKQVLLCCAALLTILFQGAHAKAQALFTTYNTSNSPLPDNSVNCIALGENQLIWIGTDQGLVRFDGQSWQVFTQQNSNLPDNTIKCLALDGDTIWVGTFTGGLAKYNGLQWQVYNQQNSGLPENHVRTIAIDSSHQKWIGTVNGFANLRNSTWTIWNSSNSPLLTNNIATIQLAHNHKRYVGTINSGLLIQTDSTFRLLTHANSGLPDNTILSIAITSNQTVLLGTANAGLVTLTNDSVFAMYTPANSGIQTYSVPAVWALSNQHWLTGSEVGGLQTVNQGAWYTYTAQNSTLPDNHIQVIASRTNEDVWLGTRTAGLVRFYDQTLGYPITQKAQAVQLYPNPCNQQSALWITGLNGHANIDIYTTQHQLIRTYKALQGQPLQKITPGLQPGVYIVHINGESQTVALKLIVQ